MPIVPTYDNFRAMPSGGGFTPVQPGYDAERATGDQLQRTGAALSGVGEAAGRMALDAQEQANEQVVMQATNRARQAMLDLTYDPQVGYLSQKGDAATTRESGQALPEEYGAKLRSALSNISTDLKNPMQQRMFQLRTEPQATQFVGDVQNHMLKEYQGLRMSTAIGAQQIATQEAELNWNDPYKVKQAIEGMPDPLTGKLTGGIRSSIYQQAKVSGMSATEAEAVMNRAESAVHAKVILAALQSNNPAYAQGYLEQNRKSMQAEDILQVQGQVTQQVSANQAMGAVQAARDAMRPLIAPTNFDRMTQITASTESGNRDFKADGSLLEGPMIPGQGTAKGRTQVMDATAANPGYGIKPARTDGTPQQIADDRARVGAEKLQVLLQRYGDPAKAWAAYNGGEGNLDKALAESQKDAQIGAFRGGPPAPDAWMAKLPTETQKYVAKNMAALQSPTDVAPRPTEAEFVNAAMSRLPPGATPFAVKLTREQAAQQFTIDNKSLNEQGENAVAAMQRWLIANGGNVAAAPTNLRDAVTRYAPGQMDNVIDFGKKLVKGENVTDPAAWHDAVAYPQELAAMPQSQFTAFLTRFSNRDQERVAKMRADYTAGKGDMSPNSINDAALNHALDNRLLSIGMDPKPTNQDGKARVGTIQKYLADGLFEQQRQQGTKLSEKDVAAYVDRQIATNVTLKGMLYGTNTMPLLSMKVSDVPAEDRDQIKAALAKRGNLQPSDDQILRTYWSVKAKNGR